MIILQVVAKLCNHTLMHYNRISFNKVIYPEAVSRWSHCISSMQMIIAHIVQILLNWIYIQGAYSIATIKDVWKINFSELSAVGFEAVLIKLIQVIVGKPALLIQG